MTPSLADSDTNQLLLDTNVVVWRRHLAPGTLRGVASISAVTLAELSAGVHMVRGAEVADIEERAARAAILQQAESEFDPIPFGREAARMFGRLSAAVLAAGRTPRRRNADLMIAATAAVEGMALVTMNPNDFVGLEKLVQVVAVPRPSTDDGRGAGSH